VGLVGASVASAVAPDSVTSRSEARSSTAEEGVFRSATVDGLRVRSAPGTGSGVLGQIYGGDQVQVITSARDSTGQVWDLVMLADDSSGGLPGGYVGWVTEEYLY
jgi:hypothetical protein